MSLSGMTGFGRADGSGRGWTWTVEARSVNGRGLEVRFKGPSGFDTLERRAKEAAQSRFARGQIGIAVQARRDAGSGSPAVDRTVLDGYLDLVGELMARRAAPPTADGLLSLKGVLDGSEPDLTDAEREALEAAVASSVDQALAALDRARRDEGAALSPAIVGFIDRIEALTRDAEREADAQVQAIRDRFGRRMAELVPDTSGLEDRIVLEAAALAAKADVREELDRLSVHVGSARGLIQDSPSGRKLDFLMQEFMREANTLCAKAATSTLTAVGLELKATIEQLREQIQNVE